MLFARRMAWARASRAVQRNHQLAVAEGAETVGHFWKREEGRSSGACKVKLARGARLLAALTAEKAADVRKVRAATWASRLRAAFGVERAAPAVIRRVGDTGGEEVRAGPRMVFVRKDSTDVFGGEGWWRDGRQALDGDGWLRGHEDRTREVLHGLYMDEEGYVCGREEGRLDIETSEKRGSAALNLTVRARFALGDRVKEIEWGEAVKSDVLKVNGTVTMESLCLRGSVAWKSKIGATSAASLDGSRRTVTVGDTGRAFTDV